MRSAMRERPLFEYFSQELDRRLPRSGFRLWMYSSFGCPVANNSFTPKTVLRVTVNIDLPVRLGHPHFLLKIDHGLCWRHRIGVTVQHEDFGYDRVPLRRYRRAQNPVQRNHAAECGAGTRQLENAAASDTVSNGRDAGRITFWPLLKCY